MNSYFTVPVSRQESDCKRFLMILTYSGFNSHPTEDRLSSRATTATVPDPMNGSSTRHGNGEPASRVPAHFPGPCLFFLLVAEICLAFVLCDLPRYFLVNCAVHDHASIPNFSSSSAIPAVQILNCEFFYHGSGPSINLISSFPFSICWRDC